MQQIKEPGRTAPSPADVLKFLFSSRRLAVTLLVIVAVGVMIRLGFWQLDRLDQRRAANSAIRAQIAAPVLDLNTANDPGRLISEEYRSISATGTFDFNQQVVLNNQVNGDRIGFQLLTPLKLAGSDTGILVERGWIPYADAQPDQWRKYDEPGTVTVKGIIRLSQDQPGFGGISDPTLAPGQSRLDGWKFINVGRIQEQVSFRLLPVYIQEAPDPSWTGLPIRSQTLPDLSDGPHLSYAIQWFIFASVLVVGYPSLVYRNLMKK